MELIGLESTIWVELRSLSLNLKLTVFKNKNWINLSLIRFIWLVRFSLLIDFLFVTVHQKNYYVPIIIHVFLLSQVTKPRNFQIYEVPSRRLTTVIILFILNSVTLVMRLKVYQTTVVIKTRKTLQKILEVEMKEILNFWFLKVESQKYLYKPKLSFTTTSDSTIYVLRINVLS